MPHAGLGRGPPFQAECAGTWQGFDTIVHDVLVVQSVASVRAPT